MKSNLVYIVLAAILLLFGTGFGQSFFSPKRLWIDSYPDIGTCEKLDATTIKLSGPIDEAMYDCALPLLTLDIETVRVTTNGGDVAAGRAIGYKISDYPRHLIVDKVCLSSCGNYFVPAAARITLLPRSVIGLHGTPDPQMLSNSDMENHMESLIDEGDPTSEGLTRILKRKSERRARQLSEEAKFAAHLGVPKGWRLYREEEDLDDGWRQHFTPGSDEGLTPDNFMIVEGPMLASCLPHVKTENYQLTLEKTVFKNQSLWSGLEETMGAYRSFGLTCSPPPAQQ
ncbi:MAG: hypothetical protein ABJN69_12330 [Hellea sp.]